MFLESFLCLCRFLLGSFLLQSKKHARSWVVESKFPVVGVWPTSGCLSPVVDWHCFLGLIPGSLSGCTKIRWYDKCVDHSCHICKLYNCVACCIVVFFGLNTKHLQMYICFFLLAWRLASVHVLKLHINSCFPCVTPPAWCLPSRPPYWSALHLSALDSIYLPPHNFILVVL